jgi:hypothetical protein
MLLGLASKCYVGGSSKPELVTGTKGCLVMRNPLRWLEDCGSQRERKRRRWTEEVVFSITYRGKVRMQLFFNHTPPTHRQTWQANRGELTRRRKIEDPGFRPLACGVPWRCLHQQLALRFDFCKPKYSLLHSEGSCRSVPLPTSLPGKLLGNFLTLRIFHTCYFPSTVSPDSCNYHQRPYSYSSHHGQTQEGGQKANWQEEE